MWPFDINLVSLADRRTLTECAPGPQMAIKVWWLCNLCLEKALGRRGEKKTQKTEDIDRPRSCKSRQRQSERKAHCQAAGVASWPCWGAAQPSEFTQYDCCFLCSGYLLWHFDWKPSRFDNWEATNPDMTFTDVHVRCFNHCLFLIRANTTPK